VPARACQLLGHRGLRDTGRATTPARQRDSRRRTRSWATQPTYPAQATWMNGANFRTSCIRYCNVRGCLRKSCQPCARALRPLPMANANAPGCTRRGSAGDHCAAGNSGSTTLLRELHADAGATVDEGNNWINMFYGPLSTVNASIAKGVAGYGHCLAITSRTRVPCPVRAVPRIRRSTSSATQAERCDGRGCGSVAGSHQGIAAVVRPGALAFGSQVLGSGNAQTVTLSNNGAAPMVIRGFCNRYAGG